MITQLIDTLYSDYNYTDYLDFCEANEIEPQPEYSNDYFNWVNNERQFAIEDFFEGLRYGEIAKADTVIITGQLGLWNGRPTIEPVIIDGDDWDCKRQRYDRPAIYKAVLKCIDDMDDFNATFNNGVLEITGYHHDGRNHFEIRLLRNGIARQREDFNANPKYWAKKINADDLYC